MTTLSLKLPADLMKRLEKASGEQRITKSAYVRKSLEESLNGATKKKKLSCYDLSRDLIEASAKSGKRVPPDLATNPKYMEGFGE